MPGTETFRAQLKASADAFVSGGITLAAANIVSGYGPQTATNTVLSSLSASAPYMTIGPCRREPKANDSDGWRDYEVTAYLYFGLPKDTANTLQTIEGFVEALANRWEAGTGMTGTIPPRVGWEIADNVMTGHAPAILVYRFRCLFIGCGV